MIRCQIQNAFIPYHRQDFELGPSEKFIRYAVFAQMLKDGKFQNNNRLEAEFFIRLWMFEFYFLDIFWYKNKNTQRSKVQQWTVDTSKKSKVAIRKLLGFDASKLCAYRFLRKLVKGKCTCYPRKLHLFSPFSIILNWVISIINFKTQNFNRILIKFNLI